ncbi:hypothetical protein [Brevundimonas sp. SORGH_AS_0993]|uniref:hypothetical protein n=1 Tax=Brevundimonas sp. SORGH_AS_0993 TaxID=3041794 RepID=UPI00278261EB|nr:hypothetical protein [Brevundimonas sp. SORGH_AS_0993]MDQ1155064.1 hypothetical protein [Brevundimonas sp. SORGH_AS_0993]
MKRHIPALLALPIMLSAMSCRPADLQGSPQVRVREKFADPKGVWRDRPAGWGRAITEPPFAMKELARRCIPRLLANCETFKGGYLSAPGRPRIYWQLQEGEPDENAASAGFTLFMESGAALIPIFWAAEANDYETPVVFWPGDGADPIIAIAGVKKGNGHYSADALFRWTNGPQTLVPIQTGGWIGAAPAPLPADLWIMKGLAFNYASGLLTARTSLWRPEDGDCCPTGGSARLIFDVRDDALVLTHATYLPPETQD